MTQVIDWENVERQYQGLFPKEKPSGIDWDSDEIMSPGEAKLALDDLLGDRINRGEWVCPICNKWERVGSTWGHGFCGDCGFITDRMSHFTGGGTEPLQKANYIEKFEEYYDPTSFKGYKYLRQYSDFPNNYSIGTILTFPCKIQDIHPGTYIVVSSSGEFRIRLDSCSKSSVTFCLAPIQVDHLGNYEVLTV